MISREQWRDFSRCKPVRTALFMLGLLLIIVSPLVGALPGPGGIFVFGAGLALALKNSEWAKRRYVRFKRRRPKAGRWADWGLRRRSFKRREEVRRRRDEQRKLQDADTQVDPGDDGERSRKLCPMPCGTVADGESQTHSQGRTD